MAVGDTLTKSTVAMTGASVALVAADPSRRSVIVGNPAANAAVTVDLTGGNAATGGVPLSPGDALEVTGMEAKLAMTASGTNGQSVTVYVGH